MADQITGEVSVRFEGKEYTLMLGPRGIGKLQKEYGRRLEPLMEMGQGDDLPDVNVLLRVVDIGLERHHADATEDVAEGLLMGDWGLPGRLIAGAFPTVEGEVGNGKGKKGVRR